MVGSADAISLPARKSTQTERVPLRRIHIFLRLRHKCTLYSIWPENYIYFVYFSTKCKRNEQKKEEEAIFNIYNVSSGPGVCYLHRAKVRSKN